MPPPQPHAARPDPGHGVPAGSWALLAGAVAGSLVLTPLGALLAVAGVVRERRSGRDVPAVAFAAVAAVDLVLLAAVGLSLVVAAAGPGPALRSDRGQAAATHRSPV